MVPVGWALIGLVLGAVGSEVLRSRRPDLVRKVEDAAERFVTSLRKPKSDEKEPQANKDE